MSTSESTAAAGRLPARTPLVTMWMSLLLFAAGLASLVAGLGGTSSRTGILLLTVTWLVLLGVTQAGAVFVAITRLVKAQWAKPYYRLAELATFAFFPFAIAGFLLIYIYARDELFYWLDPPPEEHLSAWLDLRWLLLRNLFGMLSFYALSTASLLTGIRGDSGGDRDTTEHRLYLLSPWVILSFIACNTFFAWDFGMMLIPHWHSTVFPIYFWFGNLFAGTAALIAFPALLGARNDSGSRFGAEQIRCLGMLVTGFTLMWLYFFWAQFFVIWFGNMPHETEPLWRQIYDYGPWFWTMMSGCFFIPFVMLIFAMVKRSLFAMCLIAIGINLGNWISKFLMIVPAVEGETPPHYGVGEILISVGLFAGFAAAMIFLASRLPVFSEWEIARRSHPER